MLWPVTVLFFVRHGLTPATGVRLTPPDISLSPEGRRQAVSVAERLRAVPFAAVYVSPLRRCVETAEAIAKGRELELRKVAGLSDTEYGTFSGRTFRQLARSPLWKQLQRRLSSVRFPGGETLPEVQQRVVAAIEDIAARHPKDSVGLVTHADPILLALAHYGGVHLDLFERFVISPGSVTVIALAGGVPRILRVNDSGPLDELLPRTRPAATATPKRPRALP